MSSRIIRNGFAGPPSKQRGAVIILFAVALVALLASAGLALDVSHQLINKTRLQNTADAAALAAAKVLDETADTALAAAAAQQMFDDNADDPGNFELNAANMTPVVQFSNTVAPFAPGTLPAMYVRVIANGFTLPAWFISVLGINQKTVGATAVAGPSPTINYACDLVPLIICGDPTQDPSVPGNSYWGYDDGQVHRLKKSSGAPPACADPQFIGAGNFQLAELGGSGADVVRENLAGGYDGCLYGGDTVTTQTGNIAGPVTQGLNTRFNEYLGPISPGDYPPDVIITEQLSQYEYDEDCLCANTDVIDGDGNCINSDLDVDYNYDDYQSDVAANNLTHPEPVGEHDRRTMPVMIADCTAGYEGKSTMPLLGFGCFFLLQKSIQKGLESEIIGEFAEECDSPGFAGPDPTVVPGPHVIQLYKDSDGNDA
jgi:Flp pilus assembly protein TadG